MEWGQLTTEEKTKWDKIAQNLDASQMLWLSFVGVKKCIWCKKSFDNGILKKHPNEFILFSSYSWFSPDFLVHSQTTHGFAPEVIQMFMEELTKKYGGRGNKKKNNNRAYKIIESRRHSLNDD